MGLRMKETPVCPQGLKRSWKKVLIRLVSRPCFMSTLKTELEHIKHHIKYPANKAQVIATCNNMMDVPSADKEFVTKSLPEGSFKGPDDLVRALLNKV